MAKPIKQIQQQLDQLTEQTQHFSQELYQLYQDYLKLLSQATRQQLVLAVYYLCTQVHPEHFLNLSYNEQQKLQEKVRGEMTSLEEDLLSLLISLNLTQSPLEILESILLSLPESDKEEQSLSLLNLSQQSPDAEKSTEKAEDNQAFICQHPEQLMLWCKHIESGIRHKLGQLSNQVNQHLQKAKILQNSLPPKLLEMAMQAEENGMSPAGNSPNILNLIVEAKSSEEGESDNEASEGKITKITTIYLRLSDIEFATPTLTVARKQLRQSLEKVSKLRQQFRKAQQEYAIAQAEAAWRASWIDDTP
ncbi:MAG: hypothetical protein AB4041_15965 [Microcystaceae cyanobacterium]